MKKRVSSIIALFLIVVQCFFANFSHSFANGIGVDLTSKKDISFNTSTNISDSSTDINDNIVDTAGHECITFYSDSLFNIVKSQVLSYNGTLEYCLGNPNGTWVTWTAENTLSTLNAVLYNGTYYISLRGIHNYYITPSVPIEEETRAIYSTQGSNINCVGNIETLLDYKELANNEYRFANSNTFTGLFYCFDTLVSAPSLPRLTLKEKCYEDMFSGCSSLLLPPSLPSTTLASRCYFGMFSNCTSLQECPELPATTLENRCYTDMFRGCHSLTKGVDLNADAVARYAYCSMFEDCINLLYPCDIKATKDNSGYDLDFMFYGCSALRIYHEPTTFSDTMNYNRPWRVDIPNPAGILSQVFNGCAAAVDLKGETTFYIMGGDIMVDTSNATRTYTYDTTPKTPGRIDIIAPTVGNTVEYSLDNINYSADLPSVTKAGIHKIYYKVTNANTQYRYNVTIGTFDLIIEKMTLDAYANGYVGTYDGMPHNGEVIINDLNEDYQIYYSDKSDHFESLDNPSFVDAGIYTVYYKIVTENYNDFIDSFKVEIKNAQMSLYSMSYKGMYDGKKHSGRVVVNKPSLDYGYQIKYSLTKTGTYTETPFEFDNVGSYKVYYIVSANNYVDATGYFTINISNAKIKVNAKDISVPYDSKSHEAKIELVKPTDNYTVYYSTTNGDFNSTNVPTFTDVGIYNIYYKVTAPNYNDLIGSFDLHIFSNRIDSKVNDAEFIYDGKAHKTEVVVTNPSSGYSISYSVGSTDYGSNAPSFTNSGEYTIKYTITARGYYELIGYYKIKIIDYNSKGKIIVKAKDVSFKYDGKLHAGDVEVSTPSDKSKYTIKYSTDNGQTYTNTNPSYKDVGSYVVYYKITSEGYNDTVGYFTIYIIENNNATYLLYNESTKEQLYTTNKSEYNKLQSNGWTKKGVAFYTLNKSVQNSKPVYRLYNPNAQGGDHYYTNSYNEACSLIRTGWKWDNKAKPIFYTSGSIKVYKLYNKNNGRHYYTNNKIKYKKLQKTGLVGEGVAWSI